GNGAHMVLGGQTHILFGVGLRDTSSALFPYTTLFRSQNSRAGGSTINHSRGASDSASTGNASCGSSGDGGNGGRGGRSTGGRGGSGGHASSRRGSASHRSGD